MGKNKKRTADIILIGIVAVKSVLQMPEGCCRFSPTCSAYAREAFEKKNFLFALFLAIKRILSCHPLHKGGYDPVP